MSVRRVTCPRCLRPADLPADADFCPRCGQDGLADAAEQPIDADGTPVRVGRRLAVGDACNLYHATLGGIWARRRGVFKIARDAAADIGLDRATAKLARLRQDAAARPFVPEPVATLTYRVAGDPAGRRAAVLAYHDGIDTPDALYSLEEVRTHYAAGIAARDMAWMWRRLLTVLGHTHAAGLTHGAITPAHVLIEPAGHKLVLVGWGAAGPGLARRVSLAYAPWFATAQVSPATDLQAAARAMLYVMGRLTPDPTPVEPAIERHFERVLHGGPHMRAGLLLEDFDRLIQAIWGPRQFRPFDMPSRRSEESRNDE